MYHSVQSTLLDIVGNAKTITETKILAEDKAYLNNHLLN